MCVYNPKPFHSDTPIIAYKVMIKMTPDVVQSSVSGDMYRLNKSYNAATPFCEDNIAFSEEYSKGFHAYRRLEDALVAFMNACASYSISRGVIYPALPNNDAGYCIVTVELSSLTHKGTELGAIVYIADKCKFIEIVG